MARATLVNCKEGGWGGVGGGGGGGGGGGAGAPPTPPLDLPLSDQMFTGRSLTMKSRDQPSRHCHKYFCYLQIKLVLLLEELLEELLEVLVVH